MTHGYNLSICDITGIFIYHLYQSIFETVYLENIISFHIKSVKVSSSLGPHGL